MSNTDNAMSMLSAQPQGGLQYYSWHLSLRVDRPVEGCAMRPHAYMYSKKLDERDLDKPLPSHSKKMREPPPHHEFVYRWFRGPAEEPCAFEGCPRRASFSPHDWSNFALGMRHGVSPNTVKQPAACRLQCVSTQSSLYLCTFCNSNCFVHAWKTQYTIPKNPHMNSGNPYERATSTGSTMSNYGAANNNSRSATPTPNPYSNSNAPHLRSPSFDDTASVGSQNSFGAGGATPGNNRILAAGARSPQPPGTPRAYGGYDNNNNSQEEEWVEVSRDQIFIPGPDDVGRKLKLEAAAYSHDSGERLMYRVVKTDLVLARAPDPMTRPLVVSTGLKTTTTTTASQTTAANLPSYGNPGARFRVVTYNVLAEIYATQQQYPYCDFWALSWDYRFQNILREIMDASPEVICLQEVQADHYESHLYAAMSDAGYEGVYKQKTRQSMGLAGKVDGCALFWKRSTFHLVESYSIEFNELAQRQATQLGYNTTNTNSRHNRDNDEGVAFLNRLSKDNVAQLVVLELAQPPPSSSSSKGGGSSNTQICIANTHLYSNKDFPDVKLWQSWQLLQELETFVMSRGGSPNSLPLIICGDFNSTPDTAVYELLSRQTVHPGHPDVNVKYTQQQANGEDVPDILPDAHNITHSFQLGSAYQSVLGEEPKQTNYTGQFKGVLDYVWYSIPSLRPLSAAPIPDENILTRHGEALPSTEFSSDHIMLISDFQMLPGNNGGGNGGLGGRP